MQWDNTRAFKALAGGAGTAMGVGAMAYKDHNPLWEGPLCGLCVAVALYFIFRRQKKA